MDTELVFDALIELGATFLEANSIDAMIDILGGVDHCGVRLRNTARWY